MNDLIKSNRIKSFYISKPTINLFLIFMDLNPTCVLKPKKKIIRLLTNVQKSIVTQIEFQLNLHPICSCPIFSAAGVSQARC
jgi:hypothetical protein